MKYIEKGEFIMNNINILEELLLTFIELKIDIDEKYIFIEVFNRYNEKINIYNKELLIKYLFYYSNTNIPDNIFKITSLNTFILQEMYLKDIDSNVKLAILIILIKQLELSNELFIKPKVIYIFLTQLNYLLEQFNILTNGSLDNDSEILDNYTWFSTTYIDILAKLLKLQKDNYSSPLFLPGIRKYIINFSLNQLKTIYTKINHFNDFTEELDLIKNTLESIFTFYANKEELIINEMNNEQYTFFRTYILSKLKNNNYDLSLIKKDIEYPNELLDVITMEPLIEPIELPDTKNLINKSTIELHLYNSNSDPFTRKKITMESLEDYNKQLDVLDRINEVKSKIDKINKVNK